MRRHESFMVTVQVKQIPYIVFPKLTEVLGIFQFSAEPTASSCLPRLNTV